MIDLNDLRVFEKVASLNSFSLAAHSLGMPKSTVSRSVARLEETLGARLLQRTTREVLPTAAGEQLRRRCVALMRDVEESVDFINSLTGEPRGLLCISAGIGFGINVLTEQLPRFLERYPAVDVSLDLTSREADLVANGVDVAIRIGPMSDSSLVATRLGGLARYLCASPDYLLRRGDPCSPQALAEHDCIEMPGRAGRSRTWQFVRGNEAAAVEVTPRISVNEALTIHRLVRNGAGLGIVSSYLCGPDFESGRLVRLCTEWTLAPMDVTLVYPSRRELSPVVRAFVDFLREVTVRNEDWQRDLYQVST